MDLKNRMILGFTLILSLYSCANQVSTHSKTASREPNSIGDYTKTCLSLVAEIISNRKNSTAVKQLTKLEKELLPLPPVESLDLQLENAVNELHKTDPVLAQKVRLAINRKIQKGDKANELDFSTFPQKMENFLLGPYKKIVGSRGTSEPFVKIIMIDEFTLLIAHVGDKFPWLIRWDDVMSPMIQLIPQKKLNLPRLNAETSEEIIQVLSLPKTMTSKDDLKFLNSEIRSLVSGSLMNRYISSERSLIMKIASILHDDQLIFNRPTQAEYASLREKLDKDLLFRKALRSLLFVAPTATGKTRIIGQNVISKIAQTNTQLATNKNYKKKLSIVMANTPDLVNQLAKTIGTHIHSEVTPPHYRLIQWGGLLSEDMSIEKLIQFVSDSDVPVVFITSSHTIAFRVKSDTEIKKLFELTNSLSIDEAHNSTSNTFKRVMDVGLQIAKDDRLNGNIFDSLDILGVTASPLTRTERTVEVFERSYWASIDSPGRFAKEVKESPEGAPGRTSKNVLEYVRIEQQFQNARERGEINAPETPLYFSPRDFGYNFDSIFARNISGTQPHVSLEKLKEVWKTLFPMIDNHGNGVIQTYPRDADNVAKSLSELTGRNYISLNLSEKKRDALLNAFKTGTLYEGMPVHAIVGKIKEGLDFPDAGWFISFIRYVRFPGNIQAQGRVVRLGPNKITPPIIYMGEKVDSIAYQDVRELIFNKLGKLPRSLDEGRGFSGARLFKKTYPNSHLGDSTNAVNSAIEVLFRQNNELAKEYINEEAIHPEVIAKLQHSLSDNMHTRGNLEIAHAVKQFSAEAQSFKFYRHDLGQTWKYCEMLLRAKHKGKPYSKNLSPVDIKILEDDVEMDRVNEFKSMRTWLGGISREVLEQSDIRPRGINDLADTVNSFVMRYGDKARDAFNEWSLKDEFSQAISISSDHIWSRLSFKARTEFESYILDSDGKSFEETLSEYFIIHKKLPSFYYEKLEDGAEIVVDDKISHNLALRLQARMQEGHLNLKIFSKDFLLELDKGPFLSKIVSQAMIGLQKGLIKAIRESGNKNLKEISLSFHDLISHFGAFRILNELADMKYEHALELKMEIEKVLKDPLH